MSHDHDHGHDHEHGAPEMSDEERIRRAGHIILDGVVASEGLTGEAESDQMELVFGHLLEIEAIELLLDEDTDELELDISPLMGGTLLVIRRLVAELAARDGVDPETVVMSVRAALDEAAG
ncbi:hypothetical protein [Nocardioides sp. GY 10127]|uniref:hypothetical protein n=1 Tax=Nocardioides sp. GY 10127 TaxID=2569762 RepID=UPI0010A8F25D|nr:hypothetical protein [Nocardioides sp. GY 10127]TIC82735.1 hypothetical protein E8D37_08580 [Nocardioides sp. GY 10127]